MRRQGETDYEPMNARKTISSFRLPHLLVGAAAAVLCVLSFCGGYLVAWQEQEAAYRQNMAEFRAAWLPYVNFDQPLPPQPQSSSPLQAQAPPPATIR